MLRAQKANRVLRIPEERVKDYEALGYIISDMEGNVISKPDDPKATIRELEEQLKSKDQRIAELEAQISIYAGGEVSTSREDTLDSEQAENVIGEACEEEKPDAGTDSEKTDAGSEKAAGNKSSSKKGGASKK